MVAVGTLPKHAEDPLEDLNELCGTKTLLGVRQLVLETRPKNKWERATRALCTVVWFDSSEPLKFVEQRWNGRTCTRPSWMDDLEVDVETFVTRLEKPRVVEVRHRPRKFLDSADPFMMHEVEFPGLIYLLDESTGLVILEVGTTSESDDRLCFTSTWKPEGWTPLWLEAR